MSDTEKQAAPAAEKSLPTGQGPATAPASGHGASSPSARQGWLNPAMVLATLALITALGLAWNTLNRLKDMELQLARRIGEFDAAEREVRNAARDVSALLNDLTTRLTALENRAQEAQSQQLALAAMYQELARSQDERVIADIEQTLLLAQQQLRLAGNVRAALIALEAAEARLTRLDKPQFAGLKEAIGRDIARLKLLPMADVAGINARLDVLVQSVDRLRLAVDPNPTPSPAPARAAGEGWQQWWRGALDEIRQLVRVQRLDKPDAILLPPEQAWFLRENLKLRLLAARLAMLNRDEATYKTDLGMAQAWVARYFNTQDALTQSVLASLKELATLPVAEQEADLTESLKALRSMPIRVEAASG